jgi:hypothetical protein
MSIGRGVFAFLDFDTSRPEIASEGAYAAQYFAMKCQNCRRPQLEWWPLKRCLDDGYAGVILPEAVPSLGLGFLLRIGD